MNRTATAVTVLAAAGATVVALAWVVLLLQDHGPAPPPVTPALRRPPAATGETDRRLPPPAEPAAPEPRRGAAERVRPPEPAPERRGPEAVLGRVFDAADDAPVPSFQVHLLPDGADDPLARIGRHDEPAPVPFHRQSGIFRVDAAPGLYDVVVVAPGFLPAVHEAVVVPAADGRPMDVPMHRGPGLAGRVLDEAGMAVAGIPVFLDVLALHDPTAPPPRIGLVRTGLDGSFSFSPLGPGEYAIAALEPDNTVDRVAGLRVLDGTVTVDLWLRPRHQVAVQVRDGRGQPVQSARLELRGEGRLLGAATNEAGVAQLRHVPDGSYELAVRAEGLQSHGEPLDLAGGTSEQVRFVTLQPAPDGG